MYMHSSTSESSMRSMHCIGFSSCCVLTDMLEHQLHDALEACAQNVSREHQSQAMESNDILFHVAGARPSLVMG